MNIIARLKELKGLKFHIVGTGLKSDVRKYRQLAIDLNIEDCCVWHGQILHKEVQKLMVQSDLLLFTSIMEGTPHVVLEAISNHLPVVCFDSCGQAEAVNDKVGIKIPLSTIPQSIDDFSNAIRLCYENRAVLKEKSVNCSVRKQELSWESKAQQMMDIYQKVVDKYNR